MFIPKAFELNDHAQMGEIMRAHPLATVVQHTPDGLTANHIPLHLHQEGEQMVLRGHIARANRLWQEALQDDAVLLVFQGVDAHISANWYASKAQHHRVVPTWNYVAVHAHGRIRVHDDAAWVRAQMNALTTTHEQPMGELPAWCVDDAPYDYIETMLRAVVGIEIAVTRLEGKCKVSQNQPAENRASVINALQQIDTDQHRGMAQWVQTFSSNVVEY